MYQGALARQQRLSLNANPIKRLSLQKSGENPYALYNPAKIQTEKEAIEAQKIVTKNITNLRKYFKPQKKLQAVQKLHATNKSLDLEHSLPNIVLPRLITNLSSKGLFQPLKP
jgi:hypothetical protein